MTIRNLPLDVLTHEHAYVEPEPSVGYNVYHALKPYVLVQAAGYLKHTRAKSHNKSVYFRGQSKLYPTMPPTLYRGITKSQARDKRDAEMQLELWRFLLALEVRQIMEPDASVLMVAGRALNAETVTDVEGPPSWIALPAMMKMRISTPHFLDQMKGKASPFGFVLHPRTRDKLGLTLLTPFNKDRAGWAHSPCINTHDGKGYRLDELSRADIVTLGDILCGYIQHPEIKSLGPAGEKCKAHTRGLLRRMTINGGLQHCIGKEVSRFEQGKDDFIENIDDVCIHYDGGSVTANESLVAEISARGLRKATKETRLDRKTIRRILNRQKVKASTLAKMVIGLREQQD